MYSNDIIEILAHFSSCEVFLVHYDDLIFLLL